MHVVEVTLPIHADALQNYVSLKASGNHEKHSLQKLFYKSVNHSIIFYSHVMKNIY